MYYDTIAHIYDIIYKDLDYQFQVAFVDSYVKNYFLKKKVLDLACGTGKHLYCFHKLHYQTQGMDLSKEMVKLTQKRVPLATVNKGSFLNFKLKEQFPLITCFFNSLTYNLTLVALEKTLRTILDHMYFR